MSLLTIDSQQALSIQYSRESCMKCKKGTCPCIQNTGCTMESEEDEIRVQFTVIGIRVTKEFIYCYHWVKRLHKYRRHLFKEPIIRGVTATEWPNVKRDMQYLYGSVAAVYCVTSQVAVFIDNRLLGGEEELKEYIEENYVHHLPLDYYKEGVEQFTNYVKSYNRPYAYMHISIDGRHAGVLVFMLYADIVPRTCHNFLRLCELKKKGYGGAPIHRIVKDCWIQCGGYNLTENPSLNCENFIVPLARRGVLGMANSGRDIDCSTQFFVLLQPAEWMEHKFVAFGQLIEGEDTLRKIENVPTSYESPTLAINICKAGIFRMERSCMPISKGINAYIQSHIENLTELASFLEEDMLTRVFEVIKSKIPPSTTSSGQVRATQRFLCNKQEIEGIGHGDLCVNTVQCCLLFGEHMDESETYSGPASYLSVTSDKTDKPDKPDKPYYIPLTDVTFPGEVDSTFDLMKLLKGDYCHEVDLKENMMNV